MKKIIAVLGKIIGMLVFTVLLSVILGIVLVLLFKIKLNIGNMSITEWLVMSGAELVVGIISTFFFRRYVDKKSIMSLGFKVEQFTSDTISGFLLGGGILILGFLITFGSGSIYIQYNGTSLSSLVLWMGVFVAVAFFEELLFRGYILNNLQDVMPQYSALLISSLLFALVHGTNPNMGWLPMINLFIAGILLGQSYLYTRNLYMPVLQHFTWNFFQGPVFGFKVSGEPVNNTIFQLTYQSDNLINGGKFGFEGSLVCLVLQLAAIAALYFWNKKLRLNRINNKKPADDLPVMYT